MIRRLFQVAVMQWRISPSEFWEMSMPELFWLVEAATPEERKAGMTRSEITSLQRVLHDEPWGTA